VEEVQNILATGTKSAELRMQKKRGSTRKRAHLSHVEQEHPVFVYEAAYRWIYPGVAPEGPSFSELVDKALPGKLPKTVLKSCGGAGWCNCCPTKSCGIANDGAATELQYGRVAYAAEQMRLLGNTLVQSMRDPTDTGPGICGVCRERTDQGGERRARHQPARHVARIASFIQGIEIEFDAERVNHGRRKPRGKTIGVSVYTWALKVASSTLRLWVPLKSAKVRQKSGGESHPGADNYLRGTTCQFTRGISDRHHPWRLLCLGVGLLVVGFSDAVSHNSPAKPPKCSARGISGEPATVNRRMRRHFSSEVMEDLYKG